MEKTLQKDGDKIRFGNGYEIIRLNHYNSPTDDIFAIYTANHKVMGIIRIVGTNLKIEDRYKD